MLLFLRTSSQAPQLRPVCDVTNVALQVLIKAISLNDRRALSDLYDLTAGQIYRVAMSVLKSKRDAEEVVCDIFIFVWEHGDRYDGARGSVLGWLKTIARYGAIDLLRRRRIEVPIDESIESPMSADNEPSQYVADAQDRTRLHMALDGLPPLHRKLLWLCFFEDLTHPEAAGALGIPLGTAKSHVRRSLLKLRRSMET